jgi:diadenylate cyclase
MTLDIDMIRQYAGEFWLGIHPFLEIGVLFILIYSGLYYLRGTRGAYVLSGLVITLILLRFVADTLKFEVIGWLLNGISAAFAVAIIVIFQPELRRAFAQLGSRPFMRSQRKKETINEVVTAAINLSGQRLGAIIVFQRDIGMQAIINSAIRLDARLSHQLLQSIFNRHSPLHDGGVIVRENQILAAHCILPLSQDEEMLRTLGTRHRAAVGITEETDALVVVVSEETGAISIACRGNLKQNIGPDKLARFLHSLLHTDEPSTLRSLLSEFGEDEEEKIGFSDTPIKDER